MSAAPRVSPAQAKQAIATREPRLCPACGHMKLRPVVIEMDYTDWRCFNCWHAETGAAPLIGPGYTKVEGTDEP